MIAGAALSTTGTNSTIILVGPRLLYAMAREGELPGILARVHPRFRTPHVAIAVFAAVTTAVALSGTFAELAALNAIARLLYSGTTCTAIPFLRRRFVGHFRLPGGLLLPALGTAACVFLLTGVSARQAAVGVAAAAAGVPLYLFRGTSWKPAHDRA